ncbi:unnamed protein product [Clonostachys rosea f. rosea IK726]|jgi:hypothetical protein|uniref:Uncharacterized protein n=2 Tax=Bionectria ochroleuca TaxID=29856 RepID=A0A8H7TPV6_BIOOC|nr:unnamed protein product [Clonostachys rosea f. rosea IK726]
MSIMACFLSLPAENRISIYHEVFGAGQTFFLFPGGGTQVHALAPTKSRRWNAFLFTNRLIYSEAREIVYGANRFVLVDVTHTQTGLLYNFLGGIGPANASLITHLAISFPVMDRVEGQEGEFALRGDSLRALELLRAQCTRLKTLELQVHRQNSAGLTEEKDCDSEFARVALPRIDQQLKAISSLEQVVVEVYEKALMPSVENAMQALGWIVKLNLYTVLDPPVI